MFVPVSLTVGAGGERQAGYRRVIETASRFDVLADRVQDMTVPFSTIAGDLHTQLEAAFATEGSSGASGKWAVLSPAYGAWKEKHAPGTPTLVGLRRSGPKGQRPQTYKPSGRMRREMLVPLSDRLTWHISARRLAFTPLSDIAGFHETGTDRMPARPPVDLSVTFLHSIDRTFVRWFAALMKESGV